MPRHGFTSALPSWRAARESRSWKEETGFPRRGKEKYTAASQNEFWQSYLKPGILSRESAADPAWVFRGVAFEAFDLPWKSQESNLGIEQHWGLLAQRGVPCGELAAWKRLARVL